MIHGDTRAQRKLRCGDASHTRNQKHNPALPPTHHHAGPNATSAAAEKAAATAAAAAAKKQEPRSRTLHGVDVDGPGCGAHGYLSPTHTVPGFHLACIEERKVSRDGSTDDDTVVSVTLFQDGQGTGNQTLTLPAIDGEEGETVRSADAADFLFQVRPAGPRGCRRRYRGGPRSSEVSFSSLAVSLSSSSSASSLVEMLVMLALLTIFPF